MDVCHLLPHTWTQGECLIREEDVLQQISQEGESVAVFLMPGVQYYTGQLFNIAKLTQAAHAKGITVGADLAHAVGNVPLHLHEWNVDFAVWCTYKYLNGGAGSVGAAFVHEKWTSRAKERQQQLPALQGWWGNASASRFSMKDGTCCATHVCACMHAHGLVSGSHTIWPIACRCLFFERTAQLPVANASPLFLSLLTQLAHSRTANSDFEAAEGADMWRLSNPPHLQCASLMASLDVSHPFPRKPFSFYA